mgnify:CR=1 FL=1
MGISDADLNFGVIPISHSYGFSNLLTPLIARGVPMVVEPRQNTARDPLPILPAATPRFSRNAGFLSGILRNGARSRAAETCGSAFLRVRRFRVRSRRSSGKNSSCRIHSFYGASECGGICYDREATNEEEGFVGQPMKGVDR